MSTRIMKTRDVLLLTLALLVLLLLVPTLRYQQGIPLGESQETYTVLNMYNQGSTNVYSGLTGWLVDVFSFELVIFILPVLLGLLSLVLAYRLLQKSKLPGTVQLYVLVIAATTPAFLQAFIGFSIYQLLVVLLLGLGLALRNNHWLSYVLLLLTIITEPFVGIVSGLLLLYNYTDGRKRIPALLTLVTIVFGFALQSTTSLELIQSFSITINNVFAFFGGVYGISLFVVLLGLYGIVLYLPKYSTFIKITHVLFFVLALFHEPTRVVVAIGLSFYAARGFYALQRRKWFSETVGELTLVLFICVLLFTSIVVIKDQATGFPTSSHAAAVEELQSLDVQTILTDPKYAAYYIYEGFSVFPSTYTRESIRQANIIFSSQSLPFIAPLLEQAAIDTIIIDKEMRKGAVWQRNDEGLLFIIANSKQFTPAFNYQGTEIIQYTPIS